ncbi:hypothetical protein BKA67DRAFT_532373 [Truncatella angustata]|uniref:Zn(2)-C6 fungal-type domain-containing protein n=1 Tax=Truncatella angustata TaxID=152316 RepID=A0A9P8URR6_9PEZI|nr:uncharacterized protein BKA67DRAFT_532373 [Truncatella angustata]KAH6657148.1 hypothetical protein BKA67DRAFT_532373 [Truncatella angustata]
MAASRRANITISKTSPGDTRSQENASIHPSSSERPEKRQSRHRASIACASCRGKRVRCVVLKGKLECNQCIKSGYKCVIRNDDERKRPISKVYVASLCERIKILERMLLENGLIPTQAVNPFKTRQEATYFSDNSANPVQFAVKHEQELDRQSPMKFPSPSVSLIEDLVFLPENSDSVSAIIPTVEASSEAQTGDSTSRPDYDFSCLPVYRKCPDANSAEALQVMRRSHIASHQASAPTNYYDSSTSPLPSGSLGSLGGLSVTKSPVIKRRQEQSNLVPTTLFQPAEWWTRSRRQDHLFKVQHSVFEIPPWTTGDTFDGSTALNHTTVNAVQNAARTSAEQAVESIRPNWDTANADMTKPISLERLVQSVNRATGAETKKPVASRKHELGYLSF